jgi:hypothetical protein
MLCTLLRTKYSTPYIKDTVLILDKVPLTRILITSEIWILTKLEQPLPSTESLEYFGIELTRATSR